MDRIYISKDADERLKKYIEDKGYEAVDEEGEGDVDLAIACHPDIYHCRMGIAPEAPVFDGEPSELGRKYPKDAIYNAACTGTFFIHDPAITDQSLLQLAYAMGMVFVPVKQGYAKCGTVIVDEQSVITADEGIASACEKAGLAVLRVSRGHVKLEGYKYGFLGGASGRIGDEVIFHGDLSAHPDFENIKEFIEKRELTVKWFPEFPLIDIGTIL